MRSVRRRTSGIGHPDILSGSHGLAAEILPADSPVVDRPRLHSRGIRPMDTRRGSLDHRRRTAGSAADPGTEVAGRILVGIQQISQG
jgi:hypothetical protein